MQFPFSSVTKRNTCRPSTTNPWFHDPLLNRRPKRGAISSRMYSRHGTAKEGAPLSRDDSTSLLASSLGGPRSRYWASLQSTSSRTMPLNAVRGDPGSTSKAVWKIAPSNAKKGFPSLARRPVHAAIGLVLTEFLTADRSSSGAAMSIEILGLRRAISRNRDARSSRDTEPGSAFASCIACSKIIL